MTDVVTKVVYDVKDAIKKLNDLNKKIDKTTSNTKKKFEEADEATGNWEQGLDSLKNKIGGVVTGVTGLSFGVAAMAAGVGAAAVAVGSLALQFIDLPKWIGDSTRELEQFGKSTQKVLRALDRVSAINDARINSQLQLAKEEIKNRQANTTDAQIASRKRLRFLQEELAGQKALQNEKERLEEKLSGRQASRQGAKFAGLDPDIRSASLLEEATLQAKKGNVDAAEKLVSEAESLKPLLQNQVFSLQASEDANNAIDEAIKKQIVGTKNTSAELENRVKLEQKIQNLLTDQLGLQGAEGKRVKNITKGEGRFQERDASARAIEANTEILEKELTLGRSQLEIARDSVLQTKNSITASREQVVAIGQLKAAMDAAREIAVASAREVRGEITLGELNATLEKNLPVVEKNSRAFETAVERQDFEGFVPDIEKLNRTGEAIGVIADNTAKAIKAGAGEGEALVEGVRGFGEAAGLAAANLERIGSVEIPIGVPPAAGLSTSAPTPSPSPVPAAGTGPAVINVNAEVKGGLIDAEVTTLITDIITREIRKATSQGF